MRNEADRIVPVAARSKITEEIGNFSEN